jgi:cytochrome c
VSGKSEWVKGTKVLGVHGGNLYLLTGNEWKLLARKEKMRALFHERRGGTVNRIMRNCLVIAGCAAVLGAGALLAQDSGKKSGGASGGAAAVARGKSVFQQKCAVCHFDNSDQKKIGPGLKGLSKRGTFSANGAKITDESLKTWIENGDQLMPPFKETLEPGQIKDVIAYVKTL